MPRRTRHDGKFTWRAHEVVKRLDAIKDQRGAKIDDLFFRVRAMLDRAGVPDVLTVRAAGVLPRRKRPHTPTPSPTSKEKD